MTWFVISNLTKTFIFVAGVPSAVSPAKKRPSLSSGSPNSSTGSESPSQLLIQSSQSDSSGYETSSILSTSDQPASQTSSSGQPQQQSQQKPILRQIMVSTRIFLILQRQLHLRYQIFENVGAFLQTILVSNFSLNPETPSWNPNIF